jgi:hypothetical protein
MGDELPQRKASALDAQRDQMSQVEDHAHGRHAEVDVWPTSINVGPAQARGCSEKLHPGNPWLPARSPNA